MSGAGGEEEGEGEGRWDEAALKWSRSQRLLAAAAPRGLPARPGAGEEVAQPWRVSRAEALAVGDQSGFGGDPATSDCCSRRCLLCDPPPRGWRRQGRPQGLAGPAPSPLRAAVRPGGAGGGRLGLGPVVRAPVPGPGVVLRGGCPEPPPPLRSAAGCSRGEGTWGAGGSPLQRQLVFLRRLECDTKIFLSRRVCVCLSKTRRGVASRRLGGFVIVWNLQKGCWGPKMKCGGGNKDGVCALGAGRAC